MVFKNPTTINGDTDYKKIYKDFRDFYIKLRDLNSSLRTSYEKMNWVSSEIGEIDKFIAETIDANITNGKKKHK